jgi:putative membrane protein
MAIIGPVRYSTSDWVDCIKTLPSSRILKRTKGNILFMTAWTLIWTYIYKINKITTALPSTIHSILGSALSLLLVFRTNSAYDRFWEGRKAWGSVIVGIREIAINSVIHINETYHEAIAAKLVMFSVVLKQHLQGDKISAELYPFVKDRDSVDVLQAKRNRPVAVLQELNTMFHSYLREEYRDKVEATLHEKEFQEATHSLSSQVASCERIVKQPVPLAYSRHMSRFLTLYLLTLPFTLIPYLGWLTVPTVASICWSFVSVQEIGHFIEEPFDKLTQVIPLNQMTQVILSDVKGRLYVS